MSLRDAAVNKKALQEIKKNIKKKKIRIIAATKTLSFKAILSAHNNKILNIGESKIQETIQKFKNKTKPKGLTTHLIGHLQTNKTKKAVKFFDYIQSIDTLNLAQKINKEAEKMHKIQKGYLQINIGKDPHKHGFSLQEINSACKQIQQMKNIQIKGIMTILPQGKTETETKKLYLQTKEIQEEIRQTYFKKCINLSMGMSKDYRLAIESGATEIRIGTKLFGKRE